MSRDADDARRENRGVGRVGTAPTGSGAPVIIGVASAGLALIGLAIVPFNTRVPEAAFSDYAIPDLAGAVVLSLVGGWLTARRPDKLVSRLLLVVGVGAAISFFSTEYAALVRVARPRSPLPFGALAGAMAQFAFIVPNLGLRTLLLFAFPDGLNRTAGRVVGVAAAAAAMAIALAVVGLHTPSFGPLSAPALAPFGRWAQKWVDLGLAIVTGAGVARLMVLTRRARPPARGALACFSAGALALFVAYAVPPLVRLVSPRSDPTARVGPLLLTVAVLLLSGATVAAILRYRLWDIDVILRRSLVFACVTACLTIAYLATAAIASAVFGGRGVAAFVGPALVVAGIANPVRTWVQQGVHRLLYGDRAVPDSALASLGRRLGSVADPEAVLPAIAVAIASSLRVPYVRVAVAGIEGPQLAAEWGRDLCGTVEVPLIAHGEAIGRLDVGRREPGQELDPRDGRLLDDLARQAALAALLLRRTQELQRSRERLVGAREEERRRLRRDLHDGLGPALAATTLQLDEAAELIPADANAATDLVRTLSARTQDLIGDVRRLVYELRPPTLDELGLVGAIRQLGGTLSAALSFDVESSPPEPRLPAAVEVALWRIAAEAMTNVSRHAVARHCRVKLRASRTRVELEVTDDGRGIDGARPGVGLTSARERAEELGGTCWAGPSGEGGTVVRVTIPLSGDRVE